jgi:hypothetical protein
MNRGWLPLLLAGLALVTASGRAQDKETREDSFPECLVITFRADKHAGSQELEAKVIPNLRETFQERDVLFLTVDLTSSGTRHQGKLLLNLLDQGEHWKSFKKTPGVVAIVDAFSGLIEAKVAKKEELKLAEKSIHKVLSSAEPREEKSEDEEEDNFPEQAED